MVNDAFPETSSNHEKELQEIREAGMKIEARKAEICEGYQEAANEREALNAYRTSKRKGKQIAPDPQTKAVFTRTEELLDMYREQAKEREATNLYHAAKWKGKQIASSSQMGSEGAAWEGYQMHKEMMFGIYPHVPPIVYATSTPYPQYVLPYYSPYGSRY